MNDCREEVQRGSHDVRPRFLAGGGETARLIAEFDWASTALGALETWPRSLRAATAMVIHSPAAMVLLWGHDGVMIYNDAFAEIAGGRHPGALGSPARSCFPDIADFNDRVLRLGPGGAALHHSDQRMTLTRSNHAEEGSDRAEQGVFNLACSPVLGDDERPAGVLAVVAATTAQLRTAGRQQDERGRLQEQREAQHGAHGGDFVNRQIIDSAIDYAIIATDLDGRITRWNRGATRIMEWSESEMIGAELARIFTPEDRAAGRPALELATALEKGWSRDERWHLRRSGEWFWASGELTPILNPAGVPFGFVKVLRDRTEAHRTGEALRQSEQRLRRAQEAGGVGVFSMDLATGMVSGSPEFCRIYGLDICDAIPAESISALLVPEDFAEIARYRRIDWEIAPLVVEYRIRRADTGELRWIARRGEYERDAAGKPVRLDGVVQDVTERRAAQRAIEESAAQFLTLAQTLPNHVWTAQPDGRIEWFNDRFYEYSGRARADLALERWHPNVHPDDGAVSRERWQAALESGEIYEAEFRLQRRDGAYRWHLARALPIHTTDRRIKRWIGTNTDIHERKLAEAQSTRDRDRIWSLSQELMLVCDFEGVIVAANPAAMRLLGWSEDELVGRNIEEFVHPDDWARTADEIRRLSHGLTTLAFENRYRTKDGGHRLLAWAAVPDAGFIHAVARDITLERANAAERERIWNSTNDLMGTVGPDGLLRSVNPAWSRLLGYNDAQMLGRPFSDLLAAEDRGAIAGVIKRLAAGESVRDLEDSLVHADGRRSLIAWSAEPFDGVFYIVGRNVTEQRAAEEALRQSQKMEAVGQLTGGIAHDFNNLLQGITGSLAVIQKRIAQGQLGELDRYIGGAMNSANRAAALTHRLLAFSRRQPLDPRAVIANPLIESMEDMLRRTLGERINLKFALGADVWPTMCDPNQLESAILNLVINARDAMPDGGSLTIATCNLDLEINHRRRPRDVQPGQYVRISVSDTGTGMSADTISKAFEPFFTTKPIGQGTGLGLSMIYGFARQSGGSVTIESEVGRGTTVLLYLPRHRGATLDEDPVRPPDVQSAKRNETVLVVEDEPVVRSLIVEVLNDLGYRALEAGDGPSGLAILESKRRIDLLITDIGLPGMNGRQIAEVARQSRPNFRVLFMTGYAENAAAASGFLEKGMSMIIKPFAMDMLAMRIRESLEEPAPSATEPQGP